MKQFLILSYLLITFIGTSCRSVKGSKTEEASSMVPVPSGYSAATIFNKTGLDGCGWMLELESGKWLEPVSLPDEFKQVGLKVYLIYKTSKGAGVCMAGERIEIIEIKKQQK